MLPWRDAGCSLWGQEDAGEARGRSGFCVSTTCPELCAAPVLGTWLWHAPSCLSPGFGVSPASASACVPCSEVKSPSLGWSQSKALEEQSCAFMACQAPQTAGTWGDRVPPAPLATRTSVSIGHGAGGLPQIPCQGWAPPGAISHRVSAPPGHPLLRPPAASSPRWSKEGNFLQPNKPRNICSAPCPASRQQRKA